MTDEILDVKKLLSKKDQAPEKSTLIQTDLGNLIAFDYQEYPKGFDIASVTQQALQELFVQLFQLPIKADDYTMDPLAQLPAGEMPIPREKSPPEPKAQTKWEQFAQKKGIKKKKKSRLVYDEIAKEYKPRFGFNKPLNPKEDWVLPDNPDELSKYNVKDPFELTKSLKKKENEKIAKQEEANRKRKAGQSGLDVGKKQVTLELHNSDKLDKQVLDRAVAIAQKSTASMGKFDKFATDEKKLYKTKPNFVPDDREERKKIETRIAQRVIKNTEVIDAKKAGNQLIAVEQSKSNKKQRKS